MAKTCPTVGKSNVQAVFACIEDVTGVLQKPTAADYIVPRGNASMNQVPTNSMSEELSPSLNPIDQFQNAVNPGDASIPMILRIPKDGGHIQGHALTLAAMGNVQEPGAATALLKGDAADSDQTLLLEDVGGGFMPPRGVIQIDDEKILYTGMTEADGVVTLSGCVRGFANTVAAAHTAEAVVELKSRVYYQDTCRETVSIWMKHDHLVTFGSGGVATATSFAISGENGEAIDFSVKFRQMGWCGRSFLSGEPEGNILTVVDDKGDSAAMAYTVGGYIMNTSKKLDNSGAGYRVSAVDYEAGTITVEGSLSGWADGDQIDAWLPTASAIGEPIESRSVRVFVDGKAGNIRDGSLSIGTPTEFTRDVDEEYPGESVDTKRNISMTMDVYMRAREARELGRGYKGYKVPITVQFGGGKSGRTLSVVLPRVNVVMPEIGVDGAFFTLNRTGTVLGTKGEDAVYLIQE